MQPCHSTRFRQKATVFAGRIKSLLFWQSYPHWFPFDRNHMSAQLFYWPRLPSLLRSRNPDHQFPGALCPCLSTCSADLKEMGRGKREVEEKQRETGKLTVPLSSPRWLFCWAPRLCRGTVRCPLGCSGEDRSQEETGSPVKKKSALLHFSYLFWSVLIALIDGLGIF